MELRLVEAEVAVRVGCVYAGCRGCLARFCSWQPAVGTFAFAQSTRPFNLRPRCGPLAHAHAATAAIRGGCAGFGHAVLSTEYTRAWYGRPPLGGTAGGG